MNDILKVLRFKCNLCGKCCFHPIAITVFDLWRIEKKTGLQPANFIKFTIRPDGQTAIYMHTIEDKCVFLSPDNICTINDFKPLVCEVFPFRMCQDNQNLYWMDNVINAFDQLCDFDSLENCDMKEYFLKYSQIKFYIDKYNEERTEHCRLVSIWDSSYDKNQNADVHAFLKFMDAYKNNYTDNYMDKSLTDEKLTEIMNDPDNVTRWFRLLKNSRKR